MKELETIVRAVVDNVLAALQEKSFAPYTLVLARREARCMEAVFETLGEAADVVCLGEEPAGRPPARLLLPTLSCPDMADLAAGKASNPDMESVLNLLLSGRVVEVCRFEYTRHENTAPEALYALYQGYAETLAAYGLIPAAKPRPEKTRFRKKLLTAEDVKTARDNGAKILVLPSSALVTPLAADEAAASGVLLEKECAAERPV